MCRLLTTEYTCGHKEIVPLACEFRDEGRPYWFPGRRRPCQKIVDRQTSIYRCHTCSSNSKTLILSAGQEQTEVNGNAVSLERGELITTLVRNEIFLTKRAIREKPLARSTPTHEEIVLQCLINDAFLARRHQRRCADEDLRISSLGHCYGITVEAMDAHQKAKAALSLALAERAASVEKPAVHDFASVEALLLGIAKAGTGSDGQLLTTDPSFLLTLSHAVQEKITSSIEPTIVYTAHLGGNSESEASDSPLDSPAGSTTEEQPEVISHSIDPSIARERALDILQNILGLHGLSESPITDQIADYVFAHAPFLRSCLRLSVDTNIEQLLNLLLNHNDDIMDKENESDDGSNEEFDEESDKESDKESDDGLLSLSSHEGREILAQVREFLGMRPTATPMDIYRFVRKNFGASGGFVDYGLIYIKFRPETGQKQSKKKMKARRNSLARVTPSENHEIACRELVDAFRLLNWKPALKKQRKEQSHFSDDSDEKDNREDDPDEDSENAQASGSADPPTRVWVRGRYNEVSFSGRLTRRAHIPDHLSNLRWSATHSTAGPSDRENSSSPSVVEENGMVSLTISPQFPQTTVNADSEEGRGLLSIIRYYAQLHPDMSAQELSTWLDDHSEFLRGVRFDIEPLPELLPHNIDAGNPAPSVEDRDRMAREEFAMAIRTIDWDDVENWPIPFLTNPQPETTVSEDASPAESHQEKDKGKGKART